MAQELRQVGLEVAVTKEMVETGLAEMREFRFLEEPSYVLESYYRAMNYTARPSASESNLPR